MGSADKTLIPTRPRVGKEERMSEINLKCPGCGIRPCLCCGGFPEFIETPSGLWFLKCLDQDCNEAGLEKKTKEEAITSWNKRQVP